MTISLICRRLGEALIAAAAEIEQNPGAPMAGKDEGRVGGPHSRAGDTPPAPRPSSELPPRTAPLSLRHERDASTSAAREILSLLGRRPGLKIAEIAEATERPLSTTYNAVGALCAAGKLRRFGGNRERTYRLAEVEAIEPTPAPEPPQDPQPEPEPAPPPPAQPSPEDLIARHLAEKGVTRCPTAYAAAVTGAEDRPGRLTHYAPPTHEQKRQVRAGRAAARSRAMNSGRMA